MAVSSSPSTDFSFEAQELSSLLLNASSSSSDILNSCRVVESFIDRHSWDQTRHFYITCFPVLLRKIFGFEEVLQPSGIGGWIAQTSEHSANAVVNLLSPSGALFSSIFAADEENVVRYVFPSERLPAWIRHMLQSERGLYILSEVCPALFKDRLKEDGHGGGFQVQLNAFEYFMFWFAYYAVCKDNDIMHRSDSDEMKLGFKKASRSRFEKWASSLHSLHGSHDNGRPVKFNSSPYLHLLNLYLHKFVPISDLCAPSVSVHHFFEENPSIFSRAEFVVHTFVQFWLVNDDFSPLPSRVCQSFGILLPVNNRYHRYALPSVEITEAVKILVNYVSSTLCCPQEELNSGWRAASQMDTLRLRSFSLPRSSLVVPATWSLLLQRPLYRFILRAFSYWPVGACLKKATHIIDLWLDYLQPWNIGEEGEMMPALEEDHYLEAENKMLRDRDQRLSPLSGSLLQKQKTGTDSVGSLVKRSTKESCYGYNDHWQNYVLANYPFYSSLVVQFLVFAHKFVHINTMAVLQMTHKVLSVLVSSKELLCLIRSIDSTYNDGKSGSAPCCFDSLHKVVPAIREQLQDWEGDLSNFEKGSEITHSPSQKETPMLQLFSTSDSGGHQMLKLLILRAEAWIQTGSGEKILPCMNSLEALKVLTSRIFGSCDMGAPVELVSMYNSESEKSHFVKHPGFGRHTWADIKYRGDWMRRPIEDTEVAWLARLLVRVSDWLNTRLGLDHQESAVHINNSWGENSYDSMRTSEPIFADIIDEEDEIPLVDFLSNRTTWINLFSTILSPVMYCSISLYKFALQVLRRSGCRINLRMMAEKKAENEALPTIEVYHKFACEQAAMPVIVGRKSRAETFADDLRTYTIEAMMGDGKALQAGNSHNLGQNVSRENGQRCMANFLGSKHTHGGWHYTGLMLPPRTTPIWKKLNLAETEYLHQSNRWHQSSILEISSLSTSASDSSHISVPCKDEFELGQILCKRKGVVQLSPMSTIINDDLRFENVQRCLSSLHDAIENLHNKGLFPTILLPC